MSEKSALAQKRESNKLSPSNKILLIASGKGGVGKTWFAISYAQALAQTGKRVLLFDGDLGLANVDIQLGLTPEKDLGQVVSGQSSLEGVITKYPVGGFDIIAGRSGCGSLASLSAQRLALLREDLKKLSTQYDVLLIDLGAGIGGTVRSLSSLASECYIIVTDDPTSLTDAYAFIKVTHGAQKELPLKVIINQADSTKSGQQTYETLKKVCESFLKLTPKLEGIIRKDNRVRDAIRNQTPFLTRSPTSEAAMDVRGIVERG